MLKDATVPIPREMLDAFERWGTEDDAKLRDLSRRLGITNELFTDAWFVQLHAVGLMDLKVTHTEFCEGYLEVEIVAMLERRVFEIERGRKHESTSKRQKDPQRERLKDRVKDLRGAGMKHRQICERLNEEPERYPSPWTPKTWIQMYRAERGKVDTYISDLK
jgi:hypothetical protein